ncbi:hypothetical protein BD410DRAFT_872916 [Rickenella mellea]|uniref:Uncharacterized protein n=1 Tax=Rickenella mellea TaxID=50990 RepID=A0A4Y7PGY7_9AGAM|nr:hypothetical protein BD410DRAFT_872916 [Rickenella mellea]
MDFELAPEDDGQGVGFEDEEDIEEPGGGDVEPIDVAHDPLFATRAALFDDSDHRGELEDEDEVPSAFEDHPAVRNAYIRAFVAATFEGATHKLVRLMLDGSFISLNAQNDDEAFPGLEKFARTLATVERRLGVETNSLITYFFLCDKCWSLHRRSELYELPSPTCEIDGCDGCLYTVKRMADGALKRTPTKVMPYVAPEKAIQLMLLRPGKFQQFQHWRTADDEPRPCSPSNLRGFDAFPDPSKPMIDIYDGWGWRAIQAGLERRRGGPWTMEDVDVSELDQRFVSLPCGLVWQMNLDWFQATKNSLHSTGALYMCCLNNPRGFRYLREETILVLLIPGPHEPSLEQINCVLEPVVLNFLKLGLGVKFRVHGKAEPELSHSILHHDVSDLPASRKVHGLPNHNSKYFMCPCCKTEFFQLVHPDCFDPTKFEWRNDWRYIKYAFRAQSVTDLVREDILRKRGVRWSVMNLLPGWLPGKCSVIDFMHATFLGMIKHVFRGIILGLGLLNATSPQSPHQPTDRLDNFFKGIWWPPSVSRLPPSMARGVGSAKADQWRTHISVLFVGLFIAWEEDGEIPDRDAPIAAANSKIAQSQERVAKLLQSRLLERLKATNENPSAEAYAEIKRARSDRNLRHHYDVLLQFSAAIRILSSRTISPEDAKRGCNLLSQSCQRWAEMNCHLTPYFHLAAGHFLEQFLWLGPCYGWWAYAYERHNGDLGKFNHNGHGGGELECTMMRAWWKSVQIHDLIQRLEQLQDISSEDEDSITLLKSYVKGTKKNPREDIIFPRYGKPFRLRDVECLYGMVYDRLRVLWADEIDLISDLSSGDGVPFMGKVTSYSHAFIRQSRYGASTSTRGQSGKFGYIDNRVPVQIDYIFHATHGNIGEGHFKASFAVVRQFMSDDLLPDVPWALRAIDLGVGTWYAHELGELEVVDLCRLTGQLILASANIKGVAMWITIAHDHVGS